MTKEQIKNEFIVPKLHPGEELIGFFQAQSYSLGWFILLGPLAALFTFRNYYVAVTNQGIHLHRLTLFGKLDTHNYFSWNEVESINLGKGIVTAPLKLKFSNGRKLKLRAIIRGAQQVPKLDERTKEFLLSKTLQSKASQ